MTNKSSLVSASADAASAASSALPHLESSLTENALTQALPVPDIMFGGAVMVLVIMFHAFWIRLITGSFLKRSQNMQERISLWRVDLLFALAVMALLALHLAEVVMWSAALVLIGIAPDWAKAAYFAANCYTALGEPFSLPHAWRIVPPIIAISGIFTFAWTASVLVDFVSRYNGLRDSMMVRHRSRRPDRNRQP